MRLGLFVRRHCLKWQRLESLVAELERKGLYLRSREFVQELSALYRATVVDLAYAQTHFKETTLLLFLHQLVARAHNQIYRPHQLKSAYFWHFIRNEIPQAVQLYRQALIWAAMIFLGGFVLGMAAVEFDERAASVVLPTTIIDDIDEGHMWTQQIFSVIPAPVISTELLTNNLSVALVAFAGGLTLGVGTSWILLFNGFLLGVAMKLCDRHGLLGQLLEFIASHGVLEISAFVLSGAAGLVLADALLNPGQLSRADALHEQGRIAWRMALACVPALMIAAASETFISPSSLPIGFKVTLGLSLGTLFWGYLFLTGRRGAAVSATFGPA